MLLVPYVRKFNFSFSSTLKFLIDVMLDGKLLEYFILIPSSPLLTVSESWLVLANTTILLGISFILYDWICLADTSMLPSFATRNSQEVTMHSTEIGHHQRWVKEGLYC